ncbi:MULTISPECIES: hypothetical protein [Bacillaceae]|uniref:hypothetical protein n=1 Tax=Bacillaceae TaxID=186817 RepID=UPI000E70BA10|nr:hypothetical protein [Bacillus sp. PK3_68]RJS61176.1 hypothetical protein CJ483_14890 [Bacillus sp. PK3_68]
MNQFITLLIYLIGMPMAGWTIYRSLERFIGHLDARANIKTKLNELNQLGECSHCGRLSRTYQRELVRYELLFQEDRLANTDQACPHCKKEAFFLQVEQSLPFHDKHIDCLPLEKSEYAEYEKQIEQHEELVYLSKTNELFKNKLT